MFNDLVTVVVPAYNAAGTIDVTLKSIRSQTHHNLQIFVIDDGSTDRTADIVESHAKIDSRVALVKQANAGVAAARNAGIARAKGTFIAPTDADDVWAPQKIERQLAVFQDGDSRLGLVYTWSVPIDIDGRIIGLCDKPTFAGHVLHEICRCNFVGNGSAALIRAEAFEGTGCYDSNLRSSGAEGCEDISMYIKIAEKWNFGVVPEALTGYRQVPESMSSNGLRMFRSWLLVAKAAELRNPECRDDLALFSEWMMRHNIKQERRAKRYGRVVRFMLSYPLRIFRQLLFRSFGVVQISEIDGRKSESDFVVNVESGTVIGTFPIGQPRMPSD